MLELVYFFIVWLPADPPSIIDSPANITINKDEIVTFTCIANSSVMDLTIEWICSDSSNCGSPITDETDDEYILTSTLEIIGVNNLTISCVVNQSLTSSLPGEPGVEKRPPCTRIVQKAAQLTVIPTIITKAASTSSTTTTGSFSFKGKKDDHYWLGRRGGLSLYFILFLLLFHPN